MFVLHHMRKTKLQAKKRTFLFMDSLIYIVSFVGPLTTLPQLYGIWVEKNIAGVSLLTWAGYAVLAGIWLVYGIMHKDKPIIISNTLWIVAESLVVIGLGLFKTHII